MRNVPKAYIVDGEPAVPDHTKTRHVVDFGCPFYQITESNPMDLKCIFWNTRDKDVDNEIVELILSTSANFIALAEYKGNGANLLGILKSRGVNFFAIPNIGCDRINIFTSILPGKIKARRDGSRYTIKELCLPRTERLLIGVVHLPDKRNNDDLDQTFSAEAFKVEIDDAERVAKHTNTIVFGDFNMNPFDDGMVTAPGINSIPCLKTAKRGVRTVNQRDYSFFYNPSWNLLGDLDDNPGTYFFSSPRYRSDYWNILDQLVIRPGFADRLDRSSLMILKNAGAIPLVNAEGRPSVSDHLPISFKLKLT